MADVGTAVAGTEIVANTGELAVESQLGMKALGAGLAVGLTGIGAGIAEMGIGSAAVGATAENKDLFGLVLILTVIPETIVIFGLVVALVLWFV